MLRKKQNKNEWLVILFFFATLGLVLFRKLLFSQEALFFRDFYRYFFPARLQALELLKEQGLFAWNPYLDAGLPLVADLSHHFALYPGNLLFYLFSPITAFNLLTYLHFVWAAMGMALLGLQLFRSKSAALIMSWSFALSGLFLSSIDRPGYFYTMAYLPWVVWAWGRVEGGDQRPYLLLILINSMQFLAGEVQVVILSQLIGITNILARDWSVKRLLQIGKAIVLVGSICFCLLAVQILPTWELISLSTRGNGIPFERLTVNSLHPNQLWTLIFPFPFPLFPSEPGFRAIQEVFHSEGVSLFASVHTGLLIFALSLWGLLASARKEKWFWGLGLIFFMLLSLGRFFPAFFRFARLVIPFGESFIFPIKYFLPCQFFISLLAGAALAHGGGTSRTRRFSLGYMVILLLFILSVALAAKQILGFWKGSLPDAAFAQAAGSLAQQGFVSLFFLAGLMVVLILRDKFSWMRGVLLSLVFLEMFIYAPKLIWSTPRDFFSAKPLFAETFSHARNGLLPPFRIAAFALEGTRPENPGRGVKGLAIKRQELLRGYNPNSGTLFGLAYADKYGPLRLQQTYNLWTKSGLSSEEIYRLYATRYFIHSDYALSRSNLLKKATKAGFSLYEDEKAYPLAWLTYSWQPGNKKMSSLSEPVPVDGLESFPGFSDAQENLSWVAAERIDPLKGGYRISVHAKQAAVLIVSENAYPGWQATIDGKKTVIGKAYGVFKAVSVPPGAHQLEFHYQPRLIKVGLWISLFSVMVLLTMTFFGRHLLTIFVFSKEQESG